MLNQFTLVNRQFLLRASSLLSLLLIITIVPSTSWHVNAFAEPNGCWPIHSTSTNNTGPNVTAIQYLVRRQGYTIGIDGIYGNETSSRIINIQAANGLGQDGIVGPNTWQSGLIVTLSSGDNGDGVRAVQHLLRYKFGYDIGSFGPNGDGVDGDFGGATVNAVQAFQQAVGIGVDGIVGPNTWSELVCLGSAPPPTSTNTPIPPTNTAIPPTKTPIPPTSTNTPPPSINQLQYPSGALLNIIPLNQVADGVDYSDPVASGRIPLVDLNGRLQEKLHTNFTAGEFQTNDGARYARIAPELIRGLQKIRNAVGGPVTVNSGYRHPAYNASVGGAASSRHMTGEAADIAASGYTPLQLAEIALQEMGCSIGIGLYAGHLHVDVRGVRASFVGGSNPPMGEAAFDQWVTTQCDGGPQPTAIPTQPPTQVPTHTATPIPATNTPIPVPTDTPVPPSSDQIQYPSGSRFAIINLNETQDGIDYRDPVAGGRIPLIDLNGRGQDKLHTNFTAGEFQTNDGARYARIATELVVGLQKIRNAVGGPVNVNSGYRHPAYNAAIDGATSSRHMTGEAADISASGLTTTQLAEIALAEMGCNIGIGLYAGHVHVDVRGFRASWVGGSNPPMSEIEFDAWVAEQCQDTSPPTAVPTQRPPNTPTHTPVPPPSGLCWNQHSRSQNSVGNHVYAIQYLARSLGESINADGMFGPNTEAAIKRLQAAASLPQSGVVDGNTWELALIQTISSDDNGDAVRALQHLLASKFGYDLGSFGPNGDGVDGDFGQKTVEAVRAFQQSSNLTVNGTVNPATWSALICGSPTVIVPPTQVPPTPRPTRIPDGNALVVQAQNQGFDTCTLPNLSQMQTWADDSPYDYIGIYIGGENRGCNRHNAANLTESWVSQATAQGWGFIPIWVGPQAPGNSVCPGCSEFSCNVDSARASGIAEAREAVNAAQNLGLTDAGGRGTIIYYDLEAHGGQCRDAANAFIDGWVAEVHALGNQAGIYGSSRGSYIADFATISNVPDAVWPANWISPNRYRADASPYGINGVSDDLWVGERVRQYAGDHDERYGGVSLNIDSNVADGPIATSRFGQSTHNGVQGASNSARSLNTPVEIHTNQQLVDEMHLLSAEEGWALTEEGLAWTVDGGQTWLDITPPLNDGSRLDNAFFTDTQIGWMVTNDSETITLYRTANRGQKWDRLTMDSLVTGAAAQLFADAHLHFHDANLGWLSLRFATSQSFKTGQLYKTNDGGATWMPLNLPIGEPVTFVDENVGWVAGGPANDQLYRTDDGGLSWEEQSVVAEGDINGRFVIGLPIFSSTEIGQLPVTIFENGSNSDGATTTVILYETDDGGDSWTLAQYQPNDQGALVTNGMSTHALTWLQSNEGIGSLEHVVDLNFASADLGWAQTSNASCSSQVCQVENRTLKTTDGGETWVELAVPGSSETPDEDFRLFLPLLQ